MNTEQSEKEKYSEIWKKVNYTSATAPKFAEFIKSKIPAGRSVLEIGCGNGTVLKLLKDYQAIGNDITIDAALNNGVELGRLIETPVWKLTGQFDYTVSTDVLEHLPPEKVAESISALIGCTRVETIHAVCTRPASTKHNGQQVHLTVRPVWWWRRQFEKFNHKGIKVTVINTNEL